MNEAYTTPEISSSVIGSLSADGRIRVGYTQTPTPNSLCGPRAFDLLHTREQGQLFEGNIYLLSMRLTPGKQGKPTWDREFARPFYSVIELEEADKITKGLVKNHGTVALEEYNNLREKRLAEAQRIAGEKRVDVLDIFGEMQKQKRPYVQVEQAVIEAIRQRRDIHNPSLVDHL